MIVGSAVIPPNAATFSQRLFRGIDFDPRCNSLLGVGGFADGAPRDHEFMNKVRMNCRIEPRVTEPPKAAAYHEVPAIRGWSVISALTRITMAPQLGRCCTHLHCLHGFLGQLAVSVAAQRNRQVGSSRNDV
jgi:hypothetical protein